MRPHSWVALFSAAVRVPRIFKGLGGAALPADASTSPKRRLRKRAIALWVAVDLAIAALVGGYIWLSIAPPRPRPPANNDPVAAWDFLKLPPGVEPDEPTVSDIPQAPRLKIGDLAPDFHLTTCDGKCTVDLASFRNRMPVVLIFGSLT